MRKDQGQVVAFSLSGLLERRLQRDPRNKRPPEPPEAPVVEPFRERFRAAPHLRVQRPGRRNFRVGRKKFNRLPDLLLADCFSVRQRQSFLNQRVDDGEGAACQNPLHHADDAREPADGVR